MKLGDTVKDKVTQFQGVITGRLEYLTGCRQFLLQPPLNEKAEWVESRWFDETRLEPVVDAKRLEIGNAAPAPQLPAGPGPG